MQSLASDTRVSDKTVRHWLSSEVAAVDIKSGITVAPDAFGPLDKWRRHAAERGQVSAIHAGLVDGGDARFVRDGVDVLPWSML
jgi:hypothetical protein